MEMFEFCEENTFVCRNNDRYKCRLLLPTFLRLILLLGTILTTSTGKLHQKQQIKYKRNNNIRRRISTSHSAANIATGTTTTSSRITTSTTITGLIPCPLCASNNDSINSNRTISNPETVIEILYDNNSNVQTFSKSLATSLSILSSHTSTSITTTTSSTGTGTIVQKTTCGQLEAKSMKGYLFPDSCTIARQSVMNGICICQNNDSNENLTTRIFNRNNDIPVDKNMTTSAIVFTSASDDENNSGTNSSGNNNSTINLFLRINDSPNTTISNTRTNDTITNSSNCCYNSTTPEPTNDTIVQNDRETPTRSSFTIVSQLFPPTISPTTVVSTNMPQKQISKSPLNPFTVVPTESTSFRSSSEPTPTSTSTTVRRSSVPTTWTSSPSHDSSSIPPPPTTTPIIDTTTTGLPTSTSNDVTIHLVNNEPNNYNIKNDDIAPTAVPTLILISAIQPTFTPTQSSIPTITSLPTYTNRCHVCGSSSSFITTTDMYQTVLVVFNNVDDRNGQEESLQPMVLTCHEIQKASNSGFISPEYCPYFVNAIQANKENPCHCKSTSTTGTNANDTNNTSSNSYNNSNDSTEINLIASILDTIRGSDSSNNIMDRDNIKSTEQSLADDDLDLKSNLYNKILGITDDNTDDDSEIETNADNDDNNIDDNNNDDFSGSDGDDYVYNDDYEYNYDDDSYENDDGASLYDSTIPSLTPMPNHNNESNDHNN